MHKISNPESFRKNIVDKIREVLEDDKMSINLEKGIFNYSIKEANNRKIIKKWENPYFAQIYIDRLRSIYINLTSFSLSLSHSHRNLNSKGLVRPHEPREPGDCQPKRPRISLVPQERSDVGV